MPEADQAQQPIANYPGRAEDVAASARWLRKAAERLQRRGDATPETLERYLERARQLEESLENGSL